MRSANRSSALRLTISDRHPLPTNGLLSALAYIAWTIRMGTPRICARSRAWSVKTSGGNVGASWICMILSRPLSLIVPSDYKDGRGMKFLTGGVDYFWPGNWLLFWEIFDNSWQWKDILKTPLTWQILISVT
jgi:hypothetical protein